ncbi:unnamed protein product [Closterium sp. NIES-54]
MTMLEQENRVLRQRIQAMACVDPLFPCTPPCPLASLSYQPSPSSLHQYDNAGAGEPRTAAAQPGHGECASPTSPLTSTSPLSTLPTHTFPGPSSLLPRPTRLTMLEQENRVLRQRIQAMACVNPPPLPFTRLPPALSHPSLISLISLVPPA